MQAGVEVAEVVIIPPTCLPAEEAGGVLAEFGGLWEYLGLPDVTLLHRFDLLECFGVSPVSVLHKVLQCDVVDYIPRCRHPPAFGLLRGDKRYIDVFVVVVQWAWHHGLRNGVWASGVGVGGVGASCV